MQQALHIDLSHANARSTAQALRYARSRDAQQRLRIDADTGQEGQSAVRRAPGVVALTRQASKKSVPESPFTSDVSSIGSQFTGTFNPCLSFIKPFGYRREIHDDDVGAHLDETPENADTSSRDSKRPLLGLSDSAFGSIHDGLSGLQTPGPIEENTRIALAMALSSSEVIWQYVYVMLFPYCPPPIAEKQEYLRGYAEKYLLMLKTMDADFRNPVPSLSTLFDVFCRSVCMCFTSHTTAEQTHDNGNSEKTKYWSLASFIASHHTLGELEPFVSQWKESLKHMDEDRDIIDGTMYLQIINQHVSKEVLAAGLSILDGLLQAPHADRSELEGVHDDSRFSFQDFIKDTTSNGSIISFQGDE